VLVNEVFYTLQGEGFWTGRAAVFCRFARCNLWTGREEDRKSAICTFCDTDFTASAKYTEAELVDKIIDVWPTGAPNPMVVFTGGEPLLQLSASLISQLQQFGFYVAVETNGTQRLPGPVDWVCVSPKADTMINIPRGDELKLVFPQELAPPNRFEHLDFKTFWLSPMDGPNLEENTRSAIEYCLRRPQWRLNIQTHKVIGVR